MTLLQRLRNWLFPPPAPNEPVVTMAPVEVVEAKVTKHGSTKGRVERATVRQMGATRM